MVLLPYMVLLVAAVSHQYGVFVIYGVIAIYGVIGSGREVDKIPTACSSVSIVLCRFGQ